MSQFNDAYFHSHAHSIYSANDAMASVESMVERAASLGQGGLALTDHGVMGGSFDLYRAAKAADIKAFPGVEAYFTDDFPRYKAAKRDGERYHLGLLALDLEGYQALVRLMTRLHTDRYYPRMPVLDWLDLARLKEEGATQHLACLTGCFFGRPIQELVRTQDPKRAGVILGNLAQLFPHLFVELQHHHTIHDHGSTDASVCSEMFALAQGLGLPVIATNDVHYLEAEHRKAHGVMKSLAYGKDVGVDEFPGDGYHLCDAAWVSDHFRSIGPTGERMLAEAANSYDHLLGLNKLTMPWLDSYQFLMPEVASVSDPAGELERLARQGYRSKADAGLIPDPVAYQARAKEELALIKATGFDRYFILVEDVCRYARDKGIRIQARGSANGSLLCWLLGITEVDSILWNLPMDTFMTLDRSKPPDVDLDTEKDKREALISYVTHSYEVVQQCAPSRWGYDETLEKGSLFLQFKNMKRRIAEAGQTMPTFLQTYGYMKTLEDLRRFNPTEAEGLEAVSELRPWKSYSAHAAGYVINNPTWPIETTVPTMRVGGEGGRLVTQMPMDPLEDAGYVKLDLLGSRTLESMHETLDLLGRDWSWWDDIPLDDKAVFADIAKGESDNGVFQLEGLANAIGAREVKPKTIHEVIHVISLYRPGARDWANDYVRNRKDPAKIRYVAPFLKPILEHTYGVFLFTEQVMATCRALSLDAVFTNKLLKAMKVKHGQKGKAVASTQGFLDSARAFHTAAATAGLSLSQATAIWDQMYTFSAYSFKQAHATPYGLIAYRMAWLRHHHPTEFYLGILKVVSKYDADAERSYMRAAQRARVTCLPPMVNRSQAFWSMEGPGVLRQGYVSVPKLGAEAALSLEVAQPFDTIEDMRRAYRVTGWGSWDKEGVFAGHMAELQRSGALSELGLLVNQTRTWRKVTIKIPHVRRVKVRIPRDIAQP